MAAEYAYLTAFVVGLLGGTHCVGMCGGVVGALTLGLPEPLRGRPVAMLPYLLAYNGGRLVSYTVAGALMGGVGWLATRMAVVEGVQGYLQVVAGLFMVAMGLYLGGWWFGLVHLERVGGRLWRRLEPAARRLLPVHTPRQAFLLGVVWGWLPCGLVYSVLIQSVAMGHAGGGALLLFSFGLGTLPNLLLMGVFAARLSTLLRRLWVRRLAGALVIVFGLYYLWPG